MSKRAELSEVQRTEDVDSLLRFGVKAFICELTKENQRVSNSVFSVSSYIRTSFKIKIAISSQS